MADRMISVTDAARGFSDLVNRVYYRGESVRLMRNNVAVARVIPVVPRAVPASELAAAWPTLPRLGPAEAERFERDIATAREALPPPESPWE